jgi:hypothetical protein
MAARGTGHGPFHRYGRAKAYAAQHRFRVREAIGSSCLESVRDVAQGFEAMPAARPLSGHASDAVADGTGIAHGPAAGVDLGQKILERRIEGGGLLEVDRVAAIGDDEECC